MISELLQKSDGNTKVTFEYTLWSKSRRNVLPRMLHFVSVLHFGILLRLLRDYGG